MCLRVEAMCRDTVCQAYYVCPACALCACKSLASLNFTKLCACAVIYAAFISKEHEKQAFGMNSPGPGTAKPLSASGPQKLSTRSTNPTWGFGTSRVSQVGLICGSMLMA